MPERYPEDLEEELPGRPSGRHQGLRRSARPFSDDDDTNIDFDDDSEISHCPGHSSGRYRGVRHSEGRLSHFEDSDDEFHDYPSGGRRGGGRFHSNAIDDTEEQRFRHRGGRPGGSFSESRVHELSHESDHLREPISHHRGPPHSPGAAPFRGTRGTYTDLRHAHGATSRRVSPSTSRLSY